MRSVRSAAEMGKGSRGRVEAIEAATDRAYPDKSAGVLGDGPDLVVGEAAGV